MCEPPFHATDFFAGRGDFRWLRDDPRTRRRLGLRFAAIAADHTSHGYAYGIPADDRFAILGDAFHEWWTPNGRMTPKTLAAMMVMTRMAVEVPRRLGERITAVWEDEKGIGEAIAFWKWLQKRDEPWTRAFLDFRTGGKESMELQAADLLAHEAWHWCRNAHREGTSAPSEVRPTLARILRRDRITLAVAEPEAFAELGAVFQEFANKNRGGVDPRARPYRGKLPHQRDRDAGTDA